MSSNFSSNSGSSSNSGLGSSTTSPRFDDPNIPVVAPSSPIEDKKPSKSKKSQKSKHISCDPVGHSTFENFQNRMNKNSWEAIVSVVKLPAHKIRERYFIPHDYEIIVPRSFDRMHRPPLGFCAFSLQHFDAGLTLSLAPP
ncbi:UNVERIFIED_CONTAM: hypothetical protein Sindi_0478400, partial [Sesamum indicum]